MSETTQPRGWTYANDKDGDLWRWKPGIEQMLYAASTWVSISNPQPDIRTFLSDLIIDPRPRDEHGRLVVEQVIQVPPPPDPGEHERFVLTAQLATVTAERDKLQRQLDLARALGPIDPHQMYRDLVCWAYKHAEISQGRAIELLRMPRPEFALLFAEQYGEQVDADTLAARVKELEGDEARLLWMTGWDDDCWVPRFDMLAEREDALVNMADQERDNLTAEQEDAGLHFLIAIRNYIDQARAALAAREGKGGGE